MTNSSTIDDNIGIGLEKVSSSRESVISKPESTIDSMTGKKVYNNWTQRNTDTVEKWKRVVKKSTFICETVKDKNNKVLQSVLVVALVCSTLKMVLSAVNSSILGLNPDDQDLVWVGFAISTFALVINCVNTGLLGAVKIFKWDDKVGKLGAHIVKLDNFRAVVSSELILPDKLRKDANIFITKHDDQFIHLMQQVPDMSKDEYLAALKEFKEFECGKEDFKCSQKFIEE